ncbi:MAG: hypothetical protein EB023_13305 [Flavobacteriia bacterium]|nr:hypothetical protein [Flavobacteriia bacterium]
MTDTSASGIYDTYDNDYIGSATNVGGEVTYALGNGTLAIAADQSSQSLYNNDTFTIQNVGVSYAFNLAKGLSVEPEFISTTTTRQLGGQDTEHSNTAYLRIQRDF